MKSKIEEYILIGLVVVFIIITFPIAILVTFGERIKEIVDKSLDKR